MVDVDDLQAGEVQRFKATAEAHKVDALLVVGWHRPSAEMRSSLNREGLLLWTREDILRHLLENYGSLEARVQAELGLCQVWTVS
jgi:predicted Mrr-cat superfamily restriction endonuclease